MHITRIKPSSSAPAGIERHLNACDQLISATDTRGVITYVNEAFVKISGYAKEELLGQHHNVVRHPDMPKGAFHNLWGTIRAGHSWRGAVKNRCKSGEYYWVDAYVSPIRDKGKIVGFQSVRTFLDVEARHRAQALYQHWREQNQEQLPRLKKHIPFSMELTIGLAIAPAICLPVLAVTAGLKAFIVGGILTLGMWAGAILVTRRVRSAVRVAGCVPDNPVMRYIYQGRADELSRVDYAFQIQDRELNSVAGRLADSVYHLGSLLEESILSIRGTLYAANKQTEKVEYVERAVEQMSTGQGEVGRVSSELAVRSMESRQRTESGQTSVEQLMGAISGLATELKGIYALVQETAERSQSIGAVLDVITEVAEQTNLLALNAAIEAARAGDAGRGFAVVADEVRKLAHRTNESAGEIQQIIESLQSDSHKSSSAIQAGVERSEQTMGIASKVGTELEQIMVQVRGISELALEIDASVKEQSALNEQVYQQMHDLGGLAEEVRKASSQALHGTGLQLSEHVQSMSALAQNFVRAAAADNERRP